MSIVWQVVSSVPYSNKPIVKDVIASLHSYFTSNMLIAFAIMISFKHFGGRPMECMLPVGFTGAWEEYAENFCWAQDTYFVPPEEFVESVSMEDRRERKISYYQWMPFFILFQAACFKAPTLIWKYFAGHSGMKVGEILRIASDPANSTPECRKSTVDALSVHLQGALRFHRRLKNRKLVPHKILRFLNIKYSSYYVASVYMLAKLAFMANVCFQIMLLSRYVLPEYKGDFGLYQWKKLVFGDKNTSSWHTTGVFPRATLCDFEVRDMGNVQNHTVQCVLVVNVLTEKIFVLCWTWYTVLTAITIFSIFQWLYFLYGNCSKEHFLLNHLEMSETPFNKHDDENQENVNRFIHKYLGTDGLFVLRMIAIHADVVFTTELILSLWKSYYAIEEQRKAMKRWTNVWPQHEKRLEEALLKEMEQVAEAADIASISSSRKGSQVSKAIPTAPLFSNESFKGDVVASAIRRASVGSPIKYRRNRSLENLETESKNFDESSEDEDDDKKTEKTNRSLSLAGYTILKK
uniref:Innexin n=1 Tax=Syphacia muris TaxID=451379 RepID=A0A0N5AKQ1_9BILA